MAPVVPLFEEVRGGMGLQIEIGFELISIQNISIDIEYVSSRNIKDQVDTVARSMH